MTNNNALQQAQNLTLPSHEEMLHRAPSVSHFWDSNKKLLKEAWAEWEMENKENIPLPDENLLDSRLRKAIAEAWENPEKENAVADLWEEIIPGVYVAQFFDPEKLAEFREYLQKAVEAQIPTRPPYGIALNRYGMMLDPRSDGYFAAPHFQAFYQTIMDRYMRPIARLLLGSYGYDSQTFGFSIQYNPDKDRELNPHSDASTATLNININLPDEKFTGSEVDFYDQHTSKRIQTIFESGKAMLHKGSVPHATHPITSGQRSNLVIWLYGEQMQIPRGGANSYGDFGDLFPEKSFPETVSPQDRWTIPETPKDGFAPF